MLGKNKYDTITTTSTTGNGIGFLGALTTLFIGLKLTGYIAWSWFWILSPMIIPIGLIIIITIAVIIIAGLKLK